MSRNQARGWVFTGFGLVPNALRTIITGNPDVQFACFQEEVCPDTGRDHVQGYVFFTRKKTLRFCRDLFQAHWEKRRGTHQEAKDYCTKEETRREGTEPWIFGTDPAPGRRSDITSCRDAILAGATEAQIIEDHAEVLAKYPAFVQMLQRFTVTRNALGQMPVFVPRPGWQRHLFDVLEGNPSPRKVHWRWERNGNTGKSYFALNYKPDETFVVTNGKHADVYFSYSGQRTVVFDWPRERLDTLSYGLLESFKNGYFLNTKYQSAPFRFPVPHVVVLANFPPDRNAMSEDRWDIVEIE